jgi:hypothetical protein
MDVETALKLIDDLSFEKNENRLSDLAKNIFKETWQGKTSLQIAEFCNCSDIYVKENWSDWWKLLSEEIDEKVNKSNYKGALESLERKNNYKIKYISDSYINRPPIEKNCYQQIETEGSLIRITSPQKMGKTLLLGNVLNYASNKGYQTVKLDFNEADSNVLKDYETFVKWFCFYVSDSLNLENKIDQFWQNIAGLNRNCTRYFEQYLLSEINNNLVLGLDNFEVLFNQPIFEDFSKLLRSWYDNSKTGDKKGQTWRKLRLIIVNSTEEYPQLDLNHSPFNVGVSIDLREFTKEELQTFVKNYQLTDKLLDQDLDEIMNLVGGHPYLIQQVFNTLRNEENTVANILAKAPTEEGIFSNHLGEILANLQQFKLEKSYQQILENPVMLDSKEAFKLHSLGLIKFSDNKCISSYDLYKQYFANILKDI